jgi:polysaccharide export outer membrane protein
MRKLLFFFLIVPAIYVAAQELDKTYLEALPEEIQEDIEERMSEQKKTEVPAYRLSDFSSEIKKIQLESDDFDRIFGSQFFDTMQTSFMPINTPNLDDSYVLDFGDILSIQLIGQKNIIDSFKLSRDGSINLPDIGKIYIAGLSLSDASKIINTKVKQTYIGTEVFVSLQNIRDVSVMIAGNAYNPGIYTLNGNSNILHALNVAGGIGEHGSYRSIQLIRDDAVVETIDIYDVLLHGKFVTKNRLKTGDIVFVNPRGNVVNLEGAFMRPAKYELLPSQNLGEAINYASGLTVDADIDNIFLYRILDSEVKSIPIRNISQFNNIESRDKDRVFVRKYSFRDIVVDGAILRPGSYKMTEGETVFDLIEAAGGYTDNAFPPGAIYTNKRTKEINKIALDKLYNEFLDGLIEVIQISNGGVDIQSLSLLAEEIKNVDPSGRVIIDLLDDSNPLLIQNGDTIFIPEKINNVYIFGEVNSEGALEYKQGADLDYYISQASGIKKSGNMSSIYIQFPNGKTQQIEKKRNIFASQSKNIIIEPGSVIYVPRKVDDSISSRLTATAYATILGNVSIALASLKSIND